VVTVTTINCSVFIPWSLDDIHMFPHGLNRFWIIHLHCKHVHPDLHVWAEPICYTEGNGWGIHKKTLETEVNRSHTQPEDCHCGATVVFIFPGPDVSWCIIIMIQILSSNDNNTSVPISDSFASADSSLHPSWASDHQWETWWLASFIMIAAFCSGGWLGVGGWVNQSCCHGLERKLCKCKSHQVKEYSLDMSMIIDSWIVFPPHTKLMSWRQRGLVRDWFTSYFLLLCRLLIWVRECPWVSLCDKGLSLTLRLALWGSLLRCIHPPAQWLAACDSSGTQILTNTNKTWHATWKALTSCYLAGSWSKISQLMCPAERLYGLQHFLLSSSTILALLSQQLQS
jgi:hypothetical protein